MNQHRRRQEQDNHQLVHLRNEGFDVQYFRNLQVHTSMPDDWRLYSSYSVSQPLGSAWFKRKETLLLRMPSAVVPGDENIVVNATHPDYDQLREVSREAFPFDQRFIQADQELKERRSKGAKEGKWGSKRK